MTLRHGGEGERAQGRPFPVSPLILSAWSAGVLLERASRCLLARRRSTRVLGGGTGSSGAVWTAIADRRLLDKSANLALFPVTA